MQNLSDKEWESRFRQEIISGMEKGFNGNYYHAISICCYDEQLENTKKILAEIADKFNCYYETKNFDRNFKRVMFIRKEQEE